MGMYTEVFVTGSFTEGAGANEDLLNYLFNPDFRVFLPIETDGILVTKSRWLSVTRGGLSHYFENSKGFQRTCTFDDTDKTWNFTSLAHLKNYEGEAEAFFDFLDTQPGVRYFGYHRYEETPNEPKIRTNSR